MKLVTLAMLGWLGACQAKVDDYPPGPTPGGNGGLGGNGAGADGGVIVDADGDGGVDDADVDAGVTLNGRVCVVNDLRKVGDVRECATTGANNLVVSLGTRTATTSDNGSFTILGPVGAGQVWHVANMGTTGANLIVRSAMPFGTDNIIPAIRATRYEDLLRTNGSGLDDLSGSVVIRLVRGTMGMVDVTADTLDTEQVFYDATNNAEQWAETQTGAFGIVWLPNVLIPSPLRPINLALNQQPQGTALAALTAAVEDQTITFITRDLQQ